MLVTFLVTLYVLTFTIRKLAEVKKIQNLGIACYMPLLTMNSAQYPITQNFSGTFDGPTCPSNRKFHLKFHWNPIGTDI